MNYGYRLLLGANLDLVGSATGRDEHSEDSARRGGSGSGGYSEQDEG